MRYVITFTRPEFTKLINIAVESDSASSAIEEAESKLPQNLKEQGYMYDHYVILKDMER